MYRLLYWRMKRKHKKQKENADRLGRLRREQRKEIVWLRRRVSILADGYIVEWCDNCRTQIVMLWDVEKDGRKAFCPHCGNVLMLCDSCQGECDYNYGSDICKEMR